MSRDISISVLFCCCCCCCSTDDDGYLFLINTIGQRKHSLVFPWSMSKCLIGVTEADSDYKSLYRTHRFRRISDHNKKKPRKNEPKLPENLVYPGRHKHLLVQIRPSRWFTYTNKSSGHQCDRICEVLLSLCEETNCLWLHVVFV